MPITAALQKDAINSRETIQEEILRGLSEFLTVFSLHAAEECAKVLQNLAKFLQHENVNLLQAYDEIDYARENIKNRIEDPSYFDAVYQKSIDIFMKKKRYF